MENAEIKARQIYEMFGRNKHYCHICIDEIIKTCSFIDHTKKHCFEECNSYPDYHFASFWNEVKQHINNL